MKRCARCDLQARHEVLVEGAPIGLEVCCRHMDQVMIEAGQTVDPAEFENGMILFRAHHRETCGYEA